MYNLVDIPRITNIASNSVPYRCVHGKFVRYSNNADIPGFCQCDSKWSGRYCTIEHRCNCGSGSVCLGISVNNRSICVCPIRKFGPRCLLTNTICQNGGQCIPNDEYLMIQRNLTCICQKGFIEDRCETNETKIVLSFDKKYGCRTIDIYSFYTSYQRKFSNKIDNISNDTLCTRFTDYLLITTISSCFY